MQRRSYLYGAKKNPLVLADGAYMKSSQVNLSMRIPVSGDINLQLRGLLDAVDDGALGVLGLQRMISSVNGLFVSKRVIMSMRK